MKEATVTAVKVTESVWKEIQKRKNLGDSSDDVIRRAFNMPENKETN